MTIFNRNLDLMERAMDFRVHRQALISSNLANRETPGYIAKDIVFEKELAQAYKSDAPGGLSTANAQHTDGSKPIDLSAVKGKVISSHNPDPRPDGNTVDLDKENIKMAENSIMYAALNRMATHNFQLLKTAVSEGV